MESDSIRRLADTLTERVVLFYDSEAVPVVETMNGPEIKEKFLDIRNAILDILEKQLQ